MITVKDLIEYRSENQKLYRDRVDTFLKEKVIPMFTRNKQGFEVPDDLLPLCKLDEELTFRGFKVETHSGHQGSFVYISIPSEGELK